MFSLHYRSISLQEHYNCNLLDTLTGVYLPYTAGESIAAKTLHGGTLPNKAERGTSCVFETVLLFIYPDNNGT